MLVGFGFMDSLSIPNKYLEEVIRPIKLDFPQTYKMCWRNKALIENEIIIDSVSNEVICVILWEEVDNGLNNFTEIYSIEVNKKWRHGGLGSLILQEFIADKSKVYAAVNKKTVDFFKKNGFNITNESQKYAYYIKEKR